MIRLIPIAIGAIAGGLLIRERRIRRSTERLGAASLESLLEAVDANNPETGAHVRRVASYSLILAEAADLDEHECHTIERVALFHDIGKLDGAVSDIVQEPKVLTPEELESIRTHPQRGADVVYPLAAFYPELAEGILTHHERWDGTGYPRGLAGEEIPLSARIVAIADTFDAITYARSYSRARSIAAATTVIEQGRGTQFDPSLVDLFLLPPVLEKIGKSMKAAFAPKRSPKRRRHHQPERGIPDINFRWRTQAAGRQHADR